jgi:hypothetical protein
MLTPEEITRVRELVMEGVLESFPDYADLMPSNSILAKALKSILDSIEKKHDKFEEVLRKALRDNPRAIAQSVREPLRQAVAESIGPQPEPEEFRVPEMRSLWERLLDDSV